MRHPRRSTLALAVCLLLAASSLFAQDLASFDASARLRRSASP